MFIIIALPAKIIVIVLSAHFCHPDFISADYRTNRTWNNVLKTIRPVIGIRFRFSLGFGFPFLLGFGFLFLLGFGFPFLLGFGFPLGFKILNPYRDRKRGRGRNPYRN